MRKVNKNLNTTNPALLFAQGVEQIISEKIGHPTQYQDYELDSMMRNEKRETKKIPSHSAKRGFNIVGVLKDFLWSKREIKP